MSKHNNSKTEPVTNGAATTDSDGLNELGQTPFAEDNGRDVETARLAYSYWEARGCGHGSAEEDWLRAEQEVKALRL